MISAFLLLLCNSLFLSLHLSGGAGSFPKPLTAAQEREYLRRCGEGDMEARNLLVEHNLRLVAHINQKDIVQNANREAGTRKNTRRKSPRRRIGGVHLP